MAGTNNRRTGVHGRISSVAVLLVLSISVANLLAQTEIKLAKNRYTPEQDVKLGLEAAAEVRKQFPVIDNDRITTYLTGIGDRLVEHAPAELKHPLYQYSFTPVNVKDINAFALPGGPMFVHRGMFDAAAAEGEVVGVMAHELSHVLLRHGTANMSKAQNPWLQIGQLAGMVGGSVVGGSLGSMISQGSQMGLGAVLLRYSRDFEKQADLLGAQIMARAGYDPRALARMFETIAKTSGGSGQPQWLSSHPDPGNRTQYITQEATRLQIAAAADDSGFAPVKTAFAGLPPAKSMADLERGSKGGNSAALAASTGTPGQPVPAPSAEFRNVSAGNVFKAAVPSNWTAMSSSNAVRFVPENGYGEINGQPVFSHGVELGITKAISTNLQVATNAWLGEVAKGNPQLRLAGSQQAIQMSQRTALHTPLSNASPLGGEERIGVYTTFLANGALFYYLTIVPANDAAAFQEAFRRVGESIQLAEGR